MRLEFAVSGDVQLNRDIVRVGERAQDLRPAFMQVLGLWRAETKEQFTSEGRHASGGWEPLAASTLRTKRLHGLPSKILQATTALLQSLTDPGDPNAIATVTPSELDYGTELAYVRFHQLGTSRMPQRRPVAFTEAARRETIKIVQRYLITGEISPTASSSSSTGRTPAAARTGFGQFDDLLASFHREGAAEAALKGESQ